MLTCRKCGCFKRAKESPFENIAASSQFQQELDDMSSEDDIEIEAENEDNFAFETDSD